MAITYNPIRERASYMSALGGNPTRVANFNAVWSTVSGVDLQDLVNRFNTLENSGNVAALTTLRDDINVALSSIEAVRHAYTDVDVIAPANDMRMRLSTVRSQTEARIRHYTTGFGSTRLGQAVDTAKRGMNRVVSAYKNINKPAADLYDATEKAVETGGASVYEAIGRFGKRK